MEQRIHRKQGVSRWGKVLFFAINALVILWILLNELLNNEIATSIHLNIPYLLAGIGCFLFALGAECTKYRLLLNHTGEKYRPGTALGCAVWGKYYDNITPMGAGGQPFQMYYLKKHGYSSGLSGAAPVLGFLGLQFAFVLLGLIALPLGHAYIKNRVLYLCAWAGLLCYSFVPVCILLFSVWPRPLERLTQWSCRLLSRIHLIKDDGTSSRKAMEVLSEYSRSMRVLRQQPSLCISLLALSLLFRLAISCMPWLVLRCFGAAAAFWPVFCQVVCIYSAISLIPTPGNAGAAEGSFYLVFSALGANLSWAVLLWRGLCYYSWLVLGFLYQLMEPPSISAEKRGSAQFIDVFFPTVDGVVRTVDAYAQRLNARDRCVVICPGQGTAHRQGNGYEVFRVPSVPLPGSAFRLALPGLSRSLKHYLHNEPFSVFHAHSPFTMGHFALRMGHRLGISVVATFHSKYYDDVLQITGSRFLAKAVVRYIVRFYEKVDEVWACSAGAAETLRGYGYRGEIRVMENGVDSREEQQLKEGKPLAQARFSLPPDKNILLFVGQQIWQKNLKLVLDSLFLLKENNPDYLLLVVGCGYHEQEIRDYAKEMGLNHCIRFLGKICDRKLLMGLYGSADLLFFPSRYDNAPLVLREAALAKLPALVLDGSNAAEGILDGVNGFTGPEDAFLMAEKIEFIFNASPLRQIGAEARRTIPRDWDDILQEVEEAYRQAQASNSMTRPLTAIMI